MRVRRAARGDAASLAAVTAAAEASYLDWAPVGWRPPMRTREFDARHWLALLADPQRWTAVAERADGSPVVGLASVRPGNEPDAAHLGYLFVHPDHWGAGVGRALVTAAVDEIRRRGCTMATLRVPVANTRARRLYERAGWHDSGRRRVNRWLGLEMAEYELRLP